MADVLTDTPIFSRGSTVLDYWLAHAEGLTIQPLGARVEEVVVGPPVGRAETLIVRSRVTRRRISIPAESIAAVEPSAGCLLLDPAEGSATTASLPLPSLRPSPERVAAARAIAAQSGQHVLAHAAGAARSTQAGTSSALTWLRPRALQAGASTARHSRLAAAHTANGAAWLAPRIASHARAAVAAAARLTLAVAVVVARGATRALRELERAAAVTAQRVSASLEARRARQQRTLDD